MDKELQCVHSTEYYPAIKKEQDSNLNTSPGLSKRETEPNQTPSSRGHTPYDVTDTPFSKQQTYQYEEESPGFRVQGWWEGLL